MISEGLCDTEDWSNDAENSALHHRNKLHFKIYSNRNLFFLNWNNMSRFYCIFDQTNPGLMSLRLSKKKNGLKRLNGNVNKLPFIIITIILIIIFYNTTSRMH